MQPLKILHQMSYLKTIEAVHSSELKKEVRLFYKTLYDILENPPHRWCCEKCILVPVIGSVERFQNGGLVKLIIEHVGEPCGHSDSKMYMSSVTG